MTTHQERSMEVTTYRSTSREPVQPLLREVLRFIGENNMHPGHFGMLAVNSPQLVSNMRQGRRPRPTTEARIRAFMAKPKHVVKEETKALRKRVKESGAPKAKGYGLTAQRYAELESAKDFLRKKRVVVFNAEILKPERLGEYLFGTIIISADEMVERARRHGWPGVEGR